MGLQPSTSTPPSNSPPFHVLGRAKHAFLLPTTLWGYTKPNMSTLKLVKNGGACVLSIMSSIHSIFSIFIEFKQQGFLFKQWKKGKTWRNEQPWTLDCTLVLQVMNYPSSILFLFGPIGFPSKMMHNRLNHNLICLNPWSLFKGLYQFKALRH